MLWYCSLRLEAVMLCMLGLSCSRRRTCICAQHAKWLVSQEEMCFQSLPCVHKPHRNLYSPYKHIKAVLAVKINFSIFSMFSKNVFLRPLHVMQTERSKRHGLRLFKVIALMWPLWIIMRSMHYSSLHPSSCRAQFAWMHRMFFSGCRCLIHFGCLGTLT
jgi:hypothetical protein